MLEFGNFGRRGAGPAARGRAAADARRGEGRGRRRGVDRLAAGVEEAEAGERGVGKVVQKVGQSPTSLEKSIKKLPKVNQKVNKSRPKVDHKINKKFVKNSSFKNVVK